MLLNAKAALKALPEIGRVINRGSECVQQLGRREALAGRRLGEAQCEIRLETLASRQTPARERRRGAADMYSPESRVEGGPCMPCPGWRNMNMQRLPTIAGGREYGAGQRGEGEYEIAHAQPLFHSHKQRFSGFQQLHYRDPAHPCDADQAVDDHRAPPSSLIPQNPGAPHIPIHDKTADDRKASLLNRCGQVQDIDFIFIGSYAIRDKDEYGMQLLTTLLCALYLAVQAKIGLGKSVPQRAFAKNRQRVQ